MSQDDGIGGKAEAARKAANPERREALVKIGKYSAYTAPAMMVTVRSATALTPVPTSTPPVHFA